MPRPAKRIRKAVFPVAGLGTRFLPATKAMPKEMLTVVDRPAIQHVVDEARAAGIEHFIFVTGRNKGAIEDHFDRQLELESALAARGTDAEEMLRDHEGFPNSICVHNDGNERDLETVAGVVMVPRSRELRIAFGHPCQSEFRTYFAS